MSELKRLIDAQFEDTDFVAIKVNDTWYDVHADEIDYWAYKNAAGQSTGVGYFVIDLDAQRPKRLR